MIRRTLLLALVAFGIFLVLRASSGVLGVFPEVLFGVESGANGTSGEGDCEDAAVVAATVERARWFDLVVLPAVVGLLVGLLFGGSRIPAAVEALLGGGIFGVLLLLFVGTPLGGNWIGWFGTILFVSTLMGGACVRFTFGRPKNGASS